MENQRFDITGMTCSACSSRVDKAVASLDGISDVSVNLLKNSMSVTYDPAVTSTQTIIDAVEKAGYGATPHAEKPAAGDAGRKANDTADTEKHAMQKRLILSLLFTVPLFCLSMGHMAGLPLPGFLAGAENALVFALTQFLLTLPVLVANGACFAKGIRTLIARAPNMDSLIAIGSGAAVLSGVTSLYGMAYALGHGDTARASALAGNLYFESAATILTLIALGRYLEARAKGKTSEAITRLLALAPKTARRLENGTETLIPAEQVAVGDILVVKAGDTVPADGIITEGAGYLDESALTGESVPAEKQPGDSVSGATLNQSGHFLMRATHVGDDTALAQIIRLVDEATSSKAPIARLADTVSGYFVPVVIGIAIATTLIWLWLGQSLAFSLSAGIAVLVISCPCALGLATPTAIMVGVGRGAAAGILYKTAEAIETTQAVTTVILDKTGTVTEGKPAITDIILTGDMDETALLSVAASLEKLSGHPLGQAIIDEAEKRGIRPSPVTAYTQTPGQGIGGMIGGSHCQIGNRRLTEALGITTGEAIDHTARTLAEQGKTVLCVTCGENLCGLIAVADTIRPTSVQAVARLKNMGLDTLMLTGDNARTAEAVRRATGIDTVQAEVLPQDKESAIRALQATGKRVAMIGDGINDAPALARADIGIAIGAGTDIAIESADIVLMRSDLADAVTAIRLSRAVMKTIRQNLFWAFFYNLIGIPIAAGVLYPFTGITLNPMIAAAAMSFSSVTVVANALRLRFFRTHDIAATHPETGAAQNTVNIIRLSAATTTERKHIMQQTIGIQGMNCNHCAASVEKALKAIPGVTAVTVDLAGKSATLTTETRIADDSITRAVTEAGFEVTGIR